MMIAGGGGGAVCVCVYVCPRLRHAAFEKAKQTPSSSFTTLWDKRLHPYDKTMHQPEPFIRLPFIPVIGPCHSFDDSPTACITTHPEDLDVTEVAQHTLHCVPIM